jgi:hypothetical protein
MFGRALTFMLVLADAKHPLASVPVTVYAILEVGLAVTDDPLVAERPVEGDQLYVDPPDAVKVVDDPEQTVNDDAAIVIVGFGFTLTATVDELVHPLPSVPVTV